MQNSDARAALRAWVLDPAKLSALERAAYDDLDSPWAEPCDRAAQVLRLHLSA
ncbi:hypothetical protein PLCT2_02814 [Planctomycetaceae bacterium]|nr:hypothetical protein PLCT2_02814 [Planctomycetaceae bacterium]